MALQKGDNIGSYKLTEDFRVAGGRSRISFAEKGGKRWFVKEFLSPKYPIPESPGSPRTKEFKKKQCQAFEDHQNKLMEVTKKACSDGSNLVCGKELIRVGASYYKITEAIDTSTMDPKEVAKLPYKDIMIILRSLCSSLRILHLNKIVHGDLKPENVLIKKTATGTYTSKLIDFDDSYFSGEPAIDRQSVVGTPEYYSPEVFNYISDEDEVIPGTTLTCAADIYTLGLMFCEYLTGQRVKYDTEKYPYAYVSTNDGAGVDIPYSKNVSKEMKELLLSMLEKDYTKRPTIQGVFDALKKMDSSEVGTVAAATETKVSTGDKKDRPEAHDEKLPICFPKLKIPKALADLLHGDDKSGKRSTSSETPIDTESKVVSTTETSSADVPKPSLRSTVTAKVAVEPEPSKPKVEETPTTAKPTLKIRMSK